MVFIPFDKCCACYTNAGVSMCQGDLDDGLVIQKDIENNKS